jgi:Toprim domain
MQISLTLDDINRTTGGRIGQFDVACPMCGPEKRSAANRVRKVLRIWQLEEGFATFHCARCLEHGHTRDRSAPPPDPIRLAAARQAAEEREREAVAERLSKARWLWSQHKPIKATIAETYLRTARGYRGPLPATLGFLPGRGGHGPAMIAAFGIPDEPEPGRIAIADHAVTGVHITRLAPDGSGKAGTDRDKIMIGRSLGSPIVVAPVNDLLGMAIAEGIEDALSLREATGLGAWAAGSASRLPALAAAVPDYIECVTLLVDDDPDGRNNAGELASRLKDRGVDAYVILPSAAGRLAA